MVKTLYFIVLLTWWLWNWFRIIPVELFRQFCHMLAYHSQKVHRSLMIFNKRVVHLCSLLLHSCTDYLFYCYYSERNNLVEIEVIAYCQKKFIIQKEGKYFIIVNCKLPDFFAFVVNSGNPFTRIIGSSDEKYWTLNSSTLLNNSAEIL